MSEQTSLIADLEETVADSSSTRRTVLLGRITDLFLNGDVHYTDEQIALFDDVLTRLIADLEQSAKRELVRRLAATPSPPPKVTRALALDEAPTVAAPLLIHAETLDEAALVACAETRSQIHLLAISKRAVVPEPVTDVLVERGSDMVVRSVADNAGSRFSDAGFGTLVGRAGDDDALATLIGLRSDLPRRHFVQLLAKASDAVRAHLQAARQEPAADIPGVVTRVAEAIARRTAARSEAYADATASVGALVEAGKLGEAELRRFATAGRFEHTVVAMSSLCDLPIPVVERVLLQKRPESLLFMARAIGLGWETTRAVLSIRLDPGPQAERHLDLARASFERIKHATAVQVLEFQRAVRASA